MMKFREINNEERQIFDDFVAGSNCSSVLQSYEWGDVKSLTWSAKRYAVFEDNRIVASILILKRKVLYKYIAYAPRGPILDWSNIEAFDALINGIKNLVINENWYVFKCDPEIESSNSFVINTLERKGFKQVNESIQPKASIVVDINKNENELISSFDYDTRHNIRKAERKGVIVNKENSQEGIDKFYLLFQETGKRNRFLIYSKDYFIKLFKTLNNMGCCDIFIANFNNEPIYALINTIFGNKVLSLYGASSEIHRNLKASNYIHWKAMLDAKSRGAGSYDFWGIPSDPKPESPLYGVYRFKKGFSNEEKKYIGTQELVFDKFFNIFVTKALIIAKKSVQLIKTGRIKDSLD